MAKKVDPDKAVAGGDKPKNKKKNKGTGKYEGVKLYTDVTGKDIKRTKKQLLKELALAGNAGIKSLVKDEERVGYEDAWDRADTGVNMETTDATLAAIDAERDRMMGGLEVARTKHGRHHSKAMDRMAARNVAYADAMKHAAKLSKNALKKEIAAMKLAAAGRGGGGGGGGGSRGGDVPMLGQNPNAGENDMHPVVDLFNAGASQLLSQGANPELLPFAKSAMGNYAEQSVLANTGHQSRINSGMNPQESLNIMVNDLTASGVPLNQAMAIANMNNAAQGNTVKAADVIKSGGGAWNIAKANIPGLSGLMDMFSIPQMKPVGPGVASGQGGNYTLPPGWGSKLDFGNNANTGQGPR